MNEQIKHKWLPSEPTQEMLDAERFASSLSYESHEVQAVEVYKAIWQAVPAVEKEPVAFMADDEDHGTRLCKREIIAECWGIPYVPLYTHPQPKQSEQVELKREPLSEREINKLEMESYQLLFEKWNGRAPELVDHFKAFARAIEKAHGIGVE